VASPTPSKRAWLRFKRHRLGFASLVIFVVITVLSLGAELISNDKPLLARYVGVNMVYGTMISMVPPCF
jgi:microcin C transport system permease protein